MKNLFYKELKLSIHPLTYAFVALMSLSAIAPTFPAFVPLVYFGACYTFLFIGMNKTTTTNDLLYTCMLPIRRENVVKARVFSTTFIQLIMLFLVFAFFAINHLKISPESYIKSLEENPEASLPVALTFVNLNQGLVLLGIYLICLAVFDFIYLPWFYHNGKSIIANMLVAVLSMLILGFALTFIPTRFPSFMEAITIGHANANYLLQFGILIISIGIWIGSKILVTKLSAKQLIKLDF